MVTEGGTLACTGEPARTLPPTEGTAAMGALQSPSPGQAAQGLGVCSVHPAGAGQPAPQEQLNI